MFEKPKQSDYQARVEKGPDGKEFLIIALEDFEFKVPLSFHPKRKKEIPVFISRYYGDEGLPDRIYPGHKQKVQEIAWKYFVEKEKGVFLFEEMKDDVKKL